jgi:hypothetical protein
VEDFVDLGPRFFGERVLVGDKGVRGQILYSSNNSRAHLGGDFESGDKIPGR